MSVHVFFAFSEGLAKPITVPPGTKARMLAHVAEVENKLHLKRTKYKDNPVHWDHWKQRFKHVDDKILCETVNAHNAVVRRFYENLEQWAKEAPSPGEEMTPEDAAEFWHGLELLTVPPQRWDRHYYRARMESLYEVMRGRETEGIRFDAKKLTPAQAGNVIRLFENFLDPNDIRLEVPRGHDYLASSYDGEYEWCEICGAVLWEDALATCRRRQCPIKAQAREEESA